MVIAQEQTEGQEGKEMKKKPKPTGKIFINKRGHLVYKEDGYGYDYTLAHKHELISTQRYATLYKQAQEKKK